MVRNGQRTCAGQVRERAMEGMWREREGVRDMMATRYKGGGAWWLMSMTADGG